jgi:hypothetical protein
MAKPFTDDLKLMSMTALKPSALLHIKFKVVWRAIMLFLLIEMILMAAVQQEFMEH